jgi:NADPH:quinone reductase-like Zn-dependent oxidoreductase
MLGWTATGRHDDPLALVDLDEPQPADDEVLIAVEAYSINRGETFLVEQPRDGWRPGKDVAGTVLREAADGSGPKRGQRVVGHPEHAGWAERVAVPTSKLAALPDGIATTTAAALPLAGLTALRLTRVTGSLAGKTVLLTGASGGVGHYFVELAAAQGALVTAVVSSRQRGERLLELGASEIVTDVEKTTGPFDVALESVGGDSLRAVWPRLHDRGLLVWFGQASRTPPTIDFVDWRGGMSATMRKFQYADSDTTDAADLGTLVRLVAGGRLHPQVGSVADWRTTPDTMNALVSRQIRGNAVLTVTR